MQNTWKNTICAAIAFLCVSALSVSTSACAYIPPEGSFGSPSDSVSIPDDTTSTGGSSSGGSTSTGGSSTGGNTADGSSTSTGSNTASGSSNGGNGGDTELPDVEINEQHVSIVDQAYALEYGDSLGDGYTLTGKITKIDTPSNGSYICLTFAVPGRENYPIYCYKLQGDGIDSLQVGDTITVYGKIKNYQGMVEFDKNCLLTDYVSLNPKPNPTDDPYANMSATQFYANYTVATDNTDAYYRSLHGFMSGELTVPDQAPTLSAYRPKIGDKYVRNSEMLLSEDGSTYTVVDAYGNEAFKVYRDGAYITLEEVAAYVYAFGAPPKNQTTSKDTSPTSSIWGEYLRLNHTAFSGDTSRYPYEPVLPNISGCGGDLKYYEMDVGTTGTDCDPSYTAALYNNGSKITRGAARIVYGKTDLNNNGTYEIGEFHVFYTYNHYNDFQEYLNYEGGWGETFGNITGGGTISSKYDYNPTEYVAVALQPLPSAAKSVQHAILPSKKRNIYGII